MAMKFVSLVYKLFYRKYEMNSLKKNGDNLMILRSTL